jgi:ribonuclease D
VTAKTAFPGGTTLVTDAASLAALSDRLRLSPLVSFDTEFHGEKSFFPRLCLLQFATRDEVAIVDPLAVPDLAPLCSFLHDPSVLKVVHAGSQDMEILLRLTGALPAPVFDTQVAATVAGLPHQSSLASIAKEFLGLDLPKASRYTDWSKRPLSEAQVTYAANDVRYLPALHDAIVALLEKENRLEWLAPELARISDPANYRQEPEEQFRRVKGHAALDRRSLGALIHLAAWRDREAQRRDLPRRWVVGDETLLELARSRPTAEEGILAVRGAAGKIRPKDVQGILDAVAAGAAMKEEELPRLPKRRRRPVDAESVVDLMNALVRVRARENGVATQTLAPRSELDRLADGETEDVPLLSGWRRTMVGEELLALLEGRLALALDDGRIAAVPRNLREGGE